jgi:hypothetical protein
MFPFPAVRPDWMRERDTVMVGIPDSFVGYDSEGKPVFRNYFEIKGGDGSTIFSIGKKPLEIENGAFYHGGFITAGSEVRFPDKDGQWYIPEYANSNADSLIDARFEEAGLRITSTCPDECPAPSCNECPHGNYYRIV